MRNTPRFALAVLTVLLPHAAWAREPLFLSVEGENQTQTCAAPDVLHARIAERLGRDPFTTHKTSASVFRVAFKRTQGWSAVLTLLAADGRELGARTIERKGTTCDALTEPVVLSAALLLEDFAPASPPPKVTTSPPPQAAPAQAPTKEQGRVQEPDRPLHLDAALGGGGALGLSPAPAAIGMLTIGIAGEHFRLEAGALYQFPTSTEDALSVRSDLLAGHLAPCWGWTYFRPCVVATLGRMHAEGTGASLQNAQRVNTVYAGVGPGVQSELSLLRNVLFVRAAAEVAFAVVRPSFEVGDRRAWQTPALAALLTLSLGAALP